MKVSVIVALLVFIAGNLLADWPPERYYNNVAQLGPSYLQQYLRLTQNYGMTPRMADASVWAFSKGWSGGYCAGVSGPGYHASGNGATQRAIEDRNIKSANAVIMSWSFRGAELQSLLDICWKAFLSGHERGWRDAINNAVVAMPPAPTDQDFRNHWSPSNLQDPGTPGEDPWGDLRNVPQ